MKRLTRFSMAVALLTVCIGFAYSLHSQDARTKLKMNANHPSGAFNPEKVKAIAGTQDFTLQRARDFHFTAGPVDCPNCKNMFSALVAPPAPGAKITSITWLQRRPPDNNHWYRCQEEAKCGRPEFSDPNDARLDCVGKTSCFVNRASDDGNGYYEDDFRMTYQ